MKLESRSRDEKESGIKNEQPPGKMNSFFFFFLDAGFDLLDYAGLELEERSAEHPTVINENMSITPQLIMFIRCLATRIIIRHVMDSWGAG